MAPPYRAQTLVEIEMEIHLGPTNKSTILQYIHTYYGMYFGFQCPILKAGLVITHIHFSRTNPKKNHMSQKTWVSFSSKSPNLHYHRPTKSQIPGGIFSLSLSLSLSFCSSSAAVSSPLSFHFCVLSCHGFVCTWYW